jgi:uncharacterized protein
VSRTSHVPLRTCMGCGGRAPQRELLRLAATANGALYLLEASGHRGRSGYLHRQASCWERFAARSGPVRALRRSLDKPNRAALVHRLQSAALPAMIER